MKRIPSKQSNAARRRALEPELLALLDRRLEEQRIRIFEADSIVKLVSDAIPEEWNCKDCTMLNALDVVRCLLKGVVDELDPGVALAPGAPRPSLITERAVMHLVEPVPAAAPRGAA